ncbi:MAG: leucine-rich repeat domain-containing protein [Oscillospiraceae bacterium]|nr:leucine-rich repeat domain-containing protein [Oscillospiraceae bacterium]
MVLKPRFSILSTGFLRQISVIAVSMSDSVEIIERNCFSYCCKFEDFKIPDSAQCIGDSCFLGCSSLKNRQIRVLRPLLAGSVLCSVLFHKDDHFLILSNIFF